MVNNIKTPAFYMVSDKDNIADPARVKEMFGAHCGQPKYFHMFKGEHASERAEVDINKAIAFLKNCNNRSKELKIADLLQKKSGIENDYKIVKKTRFWCF